MMDLNDITNMNSQVTCIISDAFWNWRFIGTNTHEQLLNISVKVLISLKA